MQKRLCVGIVFVAISACGDGGGHPIAPATSASAGAEKALPEPHLTDVRQLTFGGENAEAYWSFGGDQLIMQARSGDIPCDRIYRVKLSDPLHPIQVSNGEGATTCSYFLPGDQDIIYASTQLGGAACPPKPDRSQGYVWAIYPSYDIFRAHADGSGVVRLTDTPGYDAEGTVCKKDGSIIFTSVRDGDIDLYRMDADGKNVKRLTNTEGYDGGAFFSDDCSKIVWRASRPKGKDLESYRALLKQGLVRPTQLELYVANADGSDPVHITYLNAASFAPYFFPGGKRVIFSTNYGDPKGREFDLYAVDVDGTRLERITTSPGFDGFPMFSPDGSMLAFSSNRATPKGQHDTNVFVAHWAGEPLPAEERAPDRVMRDARWLADPAREGRGVGTKGLDDAGAYIEDRVKTLGLLPAASDASYRQAFDVTVEIAGDAKLSVGARAADKTVDGVKPLAFSTSGKIDGKLVLAGYGIQSDGRDDYKGVDVKGKVAVVRRFVPEDPAYASAEAKRRDGDLRRKAFVAREHGALGMIVVDDPTAPTKRDPKWKMPEEATLPALRPDDGGSEGIVALIAPRAGFSHVVDDLAAGKAVTASLDVSLAPKKKSAFNVVSRWPAKADTKLPGVILVGAHYDHLGHGGEGSFVPDQDVIHPGADDNASGTAAILEVARSLSTADVKLARDVVFVSFSGEERGLLGSAAFVKTPPAGLSPKDIFAMINLDMVGRVRANHLDIVGHDTALEFPDLVHGACDDAHLDCRLTEGGGFGPSDHASFYGAGVPVLFLFSGSHSDYHRPTDTADKLNGAGMAATADMVTHLLTSLSARPGTLTFQRTASPPPHGDARSFGASLGTIPDYSGSDGESGVLLAGVRQGGAAEGAGMRRGDLLVKLGSHDIKNVEDLMFVLTESKPGETTKATIKRDGRKRDSSRRDVPGVAPAPNVSARRDIRPLPNPRSTGTPADSLSSES